MTAAQILAALNITNTFTLGNTSAPYNTGQWIDATDWASLGITSGGGDIAPIIAQVVNPVGTVVYQNSGYANNIYTSPDTSLTDTTSPLFTLANLTGTHTAIPGNYTFNLKCSVLLADFSLFVVQKTFVIELSGQLTPTLSLQETYDCSVATYTSVDTTNYATPASNYGFSVSSITRNHETRPPFGSLESNGNTVQSTVSGTAQTNILGSPDNPLWTGTYASSLLVDVLYVKDGQYTLVYVPLYTKEQIVECDDYLCVLFCGLKTLIKGYSDNLGVNTTLANEYKQKWTVGTLLVSNISQAKQCSNETLASTYTELFYKYTGLDADCDCGCTDGPSPVIPTSVINGTDGTDGATILTGSGAPSGGAGSVGDLYINTANGYLYKKTGGSSWTYLFTIVGATGATGSNGQAGASVLTNQYPGLATQGTGWESLAVGRAPYEMAANQLSTNGDELHIKAVFTLPADPTSTQHVRITFNGNDTSNNLCIFTPGAVGLRRGEINLRLTRISNTEVNYTMYWFTNELTATNTYAKPPLKEIIYGVITMSGLVLDTNTVEIDCQANSFTAGDIVSQAFEITLFKFGVTATSQLQVIRYTVPFTTTASVTSYANVIGSLGHSLSRVYLDGELLPSSAWSYNNMTDTISFTISITGASEVAGDYL